METDRLYITVESYGYPEVVVSIKKRRREKSLSILLLSYTMHAIVIIHLRLIT